MAAALHPNSVSAKSCGRWSPKRRCQRRLKRLGPLCVQYRRRSGVTAARPGRCPLRTKRDTKTPSALHLVSTISPSVHFFEAAVNSLVGGSAVICFGLAFVPLLTYKEGDIEVGEPDELETIKWSVASIVSFFPYLNWTSWLLVAFDSDPPLPYYFLSALYLMPFLKSGFDFNGLSVFMFILGVLHMQVERVAQTEPAILGTAMGEGQHLPSVVSKYKLSSDQSKAHSISDMVKRQLKDKENEWEESEEVAKMEQQLWDQKFDEK